MKKKKQTKAQRTAAKKRRSLKVYHNDVRAVMKATNLPWREAQKLIPASVRRPKGKGRTSREEIVYAAVERFSMEEESVKVGPIEIIRENIKPATTTYQDFIDYLILAARETKTVEIKCRFFTLLPEQLFEESRAWEIFRELGAAGDSYRPNFQGVNRDG